MSKDPRVKPKDDGLLMGSGGVVCHKIPACAGMSKDPRVKPKDDVFLMSKDPRFRKDDGK